MGMERQGMQDYLGALAGRLAVSTRREMGDPPGRLTLLIDRGAPPDLASALAASIAWHTREPVALTNSADADAAHVLLRAAGDAPVPDGAPVVELMGCAGTPKVPGRRLAVRAWVDGPVRRGPDASGMVSIPSLSHTDRAELARGVLPPSTPAGVALGWVARDLAGLKVGLALGAGSYRGYAHIGILRGLARMITQNRPDGSRDDPRADSSARGAGDGRLSSSRQTRAGAWVRPRPAGAAG